MLPDPDKPLDPHHIGRSAARNCRKSGSPRSKDTAACRIGQTDPSQTPSAARTTGSVREPHPILRGWKDGHCLPYELWCTLRPPFCHRSAAKPEPLRTPAPGTPSAPARHSLGVTDDHNRSGTPVPRSRFESGQFPTGQKKEAAFRPPAGYGSLLSGASMHRSHPCTEDLQCRLASLTTVSLPYETTIILAGEKSRETLLTTVRIYDLLYIKQILIYIFRLSKK